MARVRWGISASDIDNFDRATQYKPYTGPIPLNGVYQFQLKVMKYAAATEDKHEQLRVGLELVPRNTDERRYTGYFIMAFLTITSRSQFVYVPLLDAIGVSGTDFTNRTIATEDGNITKIGQWRNDGHTRLLAEVKDTLDQRTGLTRKGVGWIGPVTDDDENESEVEEDDEEYYDEDELEDDEESDF